MSAKYTTLMTYISTTLAKVTKLALVLPHPCDLVNAYPAVIFMPDAMTNAYESTAENRKAYKFKLWVIVGAEQTTIKQIFATTLPNVVDDIIQQFDTDYNGGTIDGHRVWATLTSGTWSVNKTDKGLEAVCELSLTIELNTNN
jgi:hypothetical protein